MSSEDQKSGSAPNGGEPSKGGSSEYTPGVDDSYGYEDPYGYGASETKAPATAVAAPGSVRRPPAPPPPPPPDDDDDEGMLRMSFMDHLSELRSRIIKSVAGLLVAFIACLWFANDLWRIVSAPAIGALKSLKFAPNLVQISPLETFSIVWVKLPLLASIFVASPWILYQVWAFIAPGLYKRERRWAIPFVATTAGLFIGGGLFAYFVAFRYGLEFLLGIGKDIAIAPMISVTYYFDLFVNVTLGVGIVFELPVLLFFLTLLRIVKPRFLVRHSRYAILIIVIIAAVVTPTPDVFNLMMFAVPMVALYFVGVFASYLLVLRREHRRFPWKVVLWALLALLILAAGAVGIAIWKFGFTLGSHWPFLFHR